MVSSSSGTDSPTCGGVDSALNGGNATHPIKVATKRRLGDTRHRADKTASGRTYDPRLLGAAIEPAENLATHLSITEVSWTGSSLGTRAAGS